jgi:BlaI family transcriptional regulator, penicillinase repressor
VARPHVRGLTENELEIMQILWEHSPISIAEILDKLKRHPKPAYNSVLTLVRILEKKGHVEHGQKGKAFLYSPTLDRQVYRQSEVKNLLSRLFQGDVVDLAVSLVKSKPLSSADREELKRIIDGMED